MKYSLIKYSLLIRSSLSQGLTVIVLQVTSFERFALLLLAISRSSVAALGFFIYVFEMSNQTIYYSLKFFLLNIYCVFLLLL